MSEEFIIIIVLGVFTALFAFIALVIETHNLRLQKESSKQKTAIQSLMSELTNIRNQLNEFLTRSGSSNGGVQTSQSEIQARIGIALMNIHGNIMSINTYTRELLEMENPGDYTMKPFTETIQLVHEDSSPAYEGLSESMHGTTTQTAVNTYLIGPRNRIPIYGVYSPITLEGTSTIAFHFFDMTHLEGTIRSLTEEKNKLEMTAANLENQIQKFNTVSGIAHTIESNWPIAILLLDPSGIIHYANEASASLLGYGVQDIINKSALEILVFRNQKSEIDPNILIGCLNGELKALPTWTFITGKQGSPIPVRGMIIPFTGPDPEHGIVILMETQEENYRKETGEKAFFSGIIHDLRAPLTTIRTVSEFLENTLDTTPKDQVKEMIVSMKQSAISLIGLVNELLNISRIEQGRLTINKEAFDSSPFLRDIVNSYQSQVKEKKLSLTFTANSTRQVKIFADKTKTQEILANLIGNAIKYTTQGDITVSENTNGNRLEIRVADTGPGVSIDDQHLLFKKFQQVGAARTLTSSKSTGMGLFISKQFALAMGGDLILEKSDLGVGSVFLLTLPLAPLS